MNVTRQETDRLLGSSDWNNGYPGVMVTDTAFLRNPHYHGASDRPDTLDYERLARVTAGLAGTAVRLAQPG